MRKKWVAKWSDEGMRHTFYFTTSNNDIIARIALEIHLKFLGCNMPQKYTLEENVQAERRFSSLEAYPEPGTEEVLWVSPTPS